MYTADQTLSELTEVNPELRSSTTIFKFPAQKHTSAITYSCAEANVYKFTCSKTVTNVAGRDTRYYNWVSGKFIPELEVSLASRSKQRTTALSSS